MISMYRRNMEVANEDPGSEFINRLRELPVSQMALVQFQALYDLARDQKLIGLGLKAGEGTLHIASKVATPIVNILPVASLDSMACKQLERIEQAVPAIKKDPKQLMMSREEIVSKAMAPVSAVTQMGYDTITGIKNFAVETSAPTMERVNKVTTYGYDTIDGVKTGVAHTYEGTKDTVAKMCTVDGLKDTVGNTYTSVRSFDYTGTSDALRGIVDTRKKMLYDGIESGKQEVSNYAVATVEPAARRVRWVRQYSVDKVTGTVSGVKQVGTRLVSSVTDTVSGALDYAERSLDYYLPLDIDYENDDDTDQTSAMQVMHDGDPAEMRVRIHPASPAAGSWTRTMILMNNLNQRLYGAGTRNYKYYSTQVSDMVDQTQTRFNDGKASIQTAYTNSHNYVTTSYDSVRKRMVDSKDRVVYVYDFTKQKWISTKDYATTSYSSMKSQWENREQLITNLKEAAQKQRTAAGEMLVNAWNSPGDFLSSSYKATTNGLEATRDFAVQSYQSMAQGTRNTVTLVTNAYTWTKDRSIAFGVVLTDTWSVSHSRIAGVSGFVFKWVQTMSDGSTAAYKRIFPAQSSIKEESPSSKHSSAEKKSSSKLDYVPVKVQDTPRQEPRFDNHDVTINENGIDEVDVREMKRETTDGTESEEEESE